MQNFVTLSSRPQPQPRAARVALLTAGVGYGLLFGLGYSLFVWGYNAWALAAHAADVSWGLSLVGVAIALIAGGVAGFVGMLSPWMGVTIGVWVIAAGFLSWITGLLPYRGATMLAGVWDARFAGVEILPYLPSNQARTVLLILFNVVVGVVLGYIETVAVEWAWDRTTSRGTLSLRSWLVLAVALLVALLPAFIANGLVMRPQRTPQLRVADLVAVTLSEGMPGVEAHGLNAVEAQRHGAHFTENYTVYFAGFYTEGEALYASYVDVVFDSGYAMRCIVMGTRVSFCEDLTERLDVWVGDLVHAGITGERRWLEDRMKRFIVDDDVVAWLGTQGDRLTGDYTVNRLAQMHSWILMDVRFASGYAMVCRFHGAGVVNVDRCDVAYEIRR